MLKYATRAALLASLALLAVSSSPAQALVTAEAFGGQRTANWQYVSSDGTVKSKQITGTEFGAAVALAPLPLVPLSLGVTANAVTSTTDKQLQAAFNEAGLPAGLDVKTTGKLAGLTYGPELTVWVPLAPIQPFLRVGYLLGNYQETANISVVAPDPAFNATSEQTTKYSSSGTELGLGLRYTPVPILGIFFEYIRTSEVHSVTSMTQTRGGSTGTVDLSTLPAGMKKQEIVNTSLRLGLSISI